MSKSISSILNDIFLKMFEIRKDPFSLYVGTPYNLCNEIGSKIFTHLKRKQEVKRRYFKFVDLELKNGEFIILFIRIMNNLLCKLITNEKERIQWILDNNIYGFSMDEIRIKGLLMLIQYTFKDYNLDFTKLEQHILYINIDNDIDKTLSAIMQKIKDMKFTVVCGNPPFQPPVKSDGSGTGSRNKIWHKFVEMGFNILEEDGWIAFITPFNWRMSNLKKGVEKNAQELMWNNNIIDITPANKFFNGVGGNVTMDYWIITKDKTVKGLNITDEFRKIMFYPTNEKEKLQNYFNSFLNENDFYKININGNDKRNYNFIKSKTPNNISIFKHFNTIEQYKEGVFEWFDKKTKGFDSKKVIISNSVNINTPGAFYSLYDDGKMGCGSHALAYEVQTEHEGKKLENFINNSNIINILFKESSHLTGFGINLYLVKRIPKSWVERFNSGEDL